MDMKYEDLVYPDRRNNIFILYKDILALLRDRRPELSIFRDYWGYRKIIVIFIDGVGYYVFSKLFNIDVPRITSVYPATTANIVTMLSTGTMPDKHGIYEWNLYIPELDLLIQPLLMKHYLSKYENQLCYEGVKPSRIVYSRRIFRRLLNEGVFIKAYLRGYLKRSCYANYTLDGATFNPYINITDLSIRIRRDLNMDRKLDKLFYYVYIEGVDSIGHLYGQSTEEYYKDLKYTLKILSEEICGIDDDILIIITSDHGFMNISKMIYLDKEIPRIKKYIKSDSIGVKLVSGSPRNVYLHVYNEYIDRVYRLLDEKIGDYSYILDKDTLIKLGLVRGGRPINRIGDLIILPKDEVGIWYRHYRGEEIDLIGLHGGLSRDEIYIPLYVTSINGMKVFM